MTKLVSIRVDEQMLAEAKRLKINYSEVKWTETTARFLEKMESGDTERILEKMNLVSKNPFRYVKRLKGIPLYSLRTGKYRVIMSIERL